MLHKNWENSIYRWWDWNASAKIHLHLQEQREFSLFESSSEVFDQQWERFFRYFDLF
jgi:hypothetical protein